jgi:hypothetical protein
LLHFLGSACFFFRIKLHHWTIVRTRKLSQKIHGRVAASSRRRRLKSLNRLASIDPHTTIRSSVHVKSLILRAFFELQGILDDPECAKKPLAPVKFEWLKSPSFRGARDHASAGSKEKHYNKNNVFDGRFQPCLVAGK